MKKQQSSTAYQQFHQKLRSKYKKEKQERKQNLRQIPMKKLAESSQGSNDEEYLKKRGNNWWTKMNRRYFQQIPDRQVQNIRQFTTSQDIMQFGAIVSPLLNYYQQIICRTQPIIFQDDSIRIIYRIQNILTGKQKHILAGYFTKLSTPQSQINNQQLLLKLPNFYSFHTIGNKQVQKIQKQYNESLSQQVDIYLGAKCQDEKFIQKCLQYETNFRKQDVSQIDNQIACWNYQLNQQHQLNNMYWDQIEMAIQEQKQLYPEIPDIKNKIQEIKKYLIGCQTISYFRSGYSDKTTEQYQKALQYIKQNQQEVKEGRRAFNVNGSFFQTDCKVCFCTKNQPSNKVIYCDYCNTSFHQSCYGVVEIDQENDFICDACVYLKKMENLNKTLSKCQSPSCQICGKNKFPMKNINSHFYHVSCLILFGFAEIRQFKIHLKQGVNHDTIMEVVVQNQIQHDYCEYCIKNSFTGMQFKCSDAFCAKSYHPICAYLNGCIFKIVRKNNGVQVKVECREHTFPNLSEQTTQVYFRRFLCDFKSTSRRKQQEFKQQYQKQLQKLSKSLKIQTLNQSGMTKIFKVKRFHHHNPDKQRSVQLKKSQSIISNNSNSKSNQPQMKKTQSEKLKQPQKLSHSRF